MKYELSATVNGKPVKVTRLTTLEDMALMGDPVAQAVFNFQQAIVSGKIDGFRLEVYGIPGFFSGGSFSDIDEVKRQFDLYGV